MDNKIKYGDVSTPQFLVDKILDLLPESVWNNVDYKLATIHNSIEGRLIRTWYDQEDVGW